jgi:hypothetical protein
MTLREKHGYWKFKEETLGGKLCRTGFDMGYRPVAGETKKSRCKVKTKKKK